ncbi:MAG: SURF1 family cytochrome oxidase biogenesis protein [Candidatus Nanopelagicales bacterium]
MSDWLAVLRKPVWWGLLLALPVAMGLCLLAANWQYDRHERRSVEQARSEAVDTTAPLPLAQALPPATPLTTAEHFTPVVAAGTYDPQTILIRNRSRNDQRGLWIVSPLRLADGSVIMVLRGWVAATRDNAQVPPTTPPPAGPVEVTGVLRPSEPRKGPGILSNGEATSLNTETLCPDPSCYQAYLQMTDSIPQDSVEAVPVQGPGLGPHLGYAGQWVIFALLLPVGYVILLRREVQERRARKVPVA